jgi:hypothetical protein
MTRREEGRERNDSPPPARIAGVWVRRGSQEESEQNISSCGNDLEQAPAINAGDGDCFRPCVPFARLRRIRGEVVPLQPEGAL